MSLGINAIWRARPQRPLGLLIPRESRFVLRPPFIHTPFTSSLFSTRPPLSFPDSKEHSDAVEQGQETDEGQRDNGDEPSETPPVRRIEVVGRTDEARELRAWLSQEPKRERKKVKGPKTDLDDLEESLERSTLAGSVLVKPAKTYPNKRESRKSSRAHHKSTSTQIYLDRNLQNMIREGNHVNPECTDWRHVLSLLASRTPEESVEWIEDGMKIELREQALAAVMNDGGDEKIGAIRRRSGASIKVLRAENPSDASALSISGTRAAINNATAEFRRIAGSITITRLWTPLAPGEAKTETFSDDDFFVPPLTREEGGLWHRFKVDYNAYTTPWPTHMSHTSFEQYVASLTDSIILPHLNSVLYNPAKHAVRLDHERAVARRLQRVFSNFEARPWISCSALKLALYFLCRKGDKYLPEVRSIFVGMDRYGLQMDADVFNLMLRAPTKTRHLRKFRQTILLMTRRGFAPNLDTWILFLRMFESVEVRSYILQAMNSKNLLGTPVAIQRVAEEMASFDAEHAMNEGKDLPTFMQEQADRYGLDWLTRDAANPVLDVLCRHGRFRDAFELLDRMHAHVESIPMDFQADRIAHRPDVVSFNTIISHAHTQGKMVVAINAVRKMRTAAFTTQADRVTFHLLFEMAWKARLRSTISIIWKYASLARLTTWRMRQRVASLLSGEPVEGEWDTEHGISPTVYAQLGGERLARDLVGGEQALAKIRALGEGRHRAELGVLAAKCWPEAFGDFGPRVSLGHVLSLAFLKDHLCLSAKRKSRAYPVQDMEERIRMRPLALSLRKRRSIQEFGHGDLAVYKGKEGEPVKAEDKWIFAVVVAQNRKKLTVLHVPSQFDGDETLADEQEYSPGEPDPDHSEASTPRTVAILDPEVWADAWREDQGLDIEAPPRHELQTSNEDDILAALGRLEVNYMSFRKVVSVSEEDDGLDDFAADKAEDGLYENPEIAWRQIRRPHSREKSSMVEHGGRTSGKEDDHRR
ncbi:hypothetical protein Daus18300_010314 [Diaporthe australafricana]|uniref:Pentatricopeptide repeat domain-containing protein n=1 Tax=Diaporthe australafricana TaxID=127596 RepID=A0ABR3WB28_9PEZI